MQKKAHNEGAEREPASEAFHMPAEKGVRIVISRDDMLIIQNRLEEVRKHLQDTHPIEGYKRITEMAEGFKHTHEKAIKAFVKDDRLTEAAVGLIQEIGGKFLTKEEVEKAVKEFQGAGYFKGEQKAGSISKEAGTYFHCRINIDEEAINEDAPVLVHEVEHYLHFFLMRQNIDSDLLLKMVKEFVKPLDCDDEIAVGIALAFANRRSWYKEGFADALQRDWEIKNDVPKRYDGAEDFRQIDYAMHHAKILNVLLEKEPAEFRKLMENPSYALCWDSRGDRVIHSLAAQFDIKPDRNVEGHPEWYWA